MFVCVKVFVCVKEHMPVCVTEDETVGWPHQFKRHELGQSLGDDEGQGSLACSSPWGCEESEMF